MRDFAWPAVTQDVHYAVRTLRKSPGFTAVAVLILTLGVGANTAIFSLVSAVLLKPLPFAEPERLAMLWQDFTSVGGTGQLNPNAGTYGDWKTRSQSFEDMALFEARGYNLTQSGEPVRLSGVRTTTNLFDVLGMQPIAGRTFAPDDEAPGALPVVVMSETLWTERFGADPALIGREIVVDGLQRTVIGIVPPDFAFPFDDGSIWVPAAYTPQELASRGQFVYNVVARLAPGVTLAAAQAELDTLARNLQSEQPNANGRSEFVVTNLQAQLATTVRPTLLVLLAAVGAVLLITCANIANLLLVRGAQRAKEFAIRKAVGAGRGRVLRQLLTESAVLAAVGVALGVALSTLSFDYLSRLIPEVFSDGRAPSLDWRVFAFTAGLVVLTALLFGAGPALTAARKDFNETLRTSGANVTRGGSRMRSALVVAEITLTVVLLVAAGLLLRSYAAVLAVDPGFRPDNLLIAETALSPNRYADKAARDDYYRRVLERVASLPGVSSAGYANAAPLAIKWGQTFVSIEGIPPPTPEEQARYIVNNRVVTPDYLSTLGVPLIAGRHFDARDTPDTPLVALVNRTMAERYWPGEDAVGRRFKLGPPNAPWATVVGVVGDMRQMGLDVPTAPELYFQTEQMTAGVPPFFWPQHLLVRTQVDPMTLAAVVREAVWDVDASQPVSTMRTMRDVVDSELTNRNTQLMLLGAFAALALLLAAVGLYGVLAYTVVQRTKEIGLRMSVGAQRGNIVRAVLRNALLLAAAGVGLGLAGALGVTRLLSSFLFGVTPADPLTLAGVVAALLIVVLAASAVPALRAARVDPMKALRAE
jgi:putative ABC transport system permease protein